jgi:23S rRNA (guanine1835-N2)-methyltransferase
MLTSLTLRDRNLNLVRYPEHLQHKSWQAWDAADEYLIEYVEQQFPDYINKKVRIYNDDFGALGCWFVESQPLWINDSFVAHKSCQLNLTNNLLDQNKIQFQDSLAESEQAAELVLMKVPKTLALLEQQLIGLQKVVNADTQVIAAGKITSIQKSTQALFDKYLGPSRTSLAKKKSRLILCHPEGNKVHTSPYPTLWQTESPAFTLANHANVFSRQQLDLGARALLAHLPNCLGKRVIDLGCGNGVLGINLLNQYPDCQLVFVDESYMAVASAQLNVQHNMPDSLQRCEFLVSNCLDEFNPENDESNIDVVLCNPPFHQQNTITDHIAWQMFQDAKRVLKKGGELRVVGNRHLDYPDKLKRLFGNCKVIASDRKFSILSALKR